MKSFLILFSILFSVAQLNLENVREEYKNAIKSSSKTTTLYNKLEKVTKSDNVELVAYKGAITALKAKSEKGAKQKKEGFKEGVSWVEYAAKKSPNNIEVCFIRLSIQQNIPKFLKYNNHITSDKKKVLNGYKNISSSDLKKHIKDYINSSTKFTASEKAIVN